MDDRDEAEEPYKITNFFEHQEARNEMPYDGILGSLPSWVPEPIKIEFERNRNYVLDVWQYEPDEAVRLLNEFYSAETILNYPIRYPSGQDLDFGFFSDKFGYLVKIFEAIELGPDKGIKILGGSIAQRGYRNKSNIGPRSIDLFSQLLDKVYLQLSESLSKPPTNKQILVALDERANSGDEVVQEVDFESELIYWKTPSKENSLNFRQFRNRMTDTRKRFKMEKS